MCIRDRDEEQDRLRVGEIEVDERCEKQRRSRQLGGHATDEGSRELLAGDSAAPPPGDRSEDHRHSEPAEAEGLVDVEPLLGRRTDKRVVGDVADRAHDHVAVSYTHLDVYKRQSGE